MKTTEQDNAGVIAPPPLIFAGALGLGLLLQRMLPLRFAKRRRPFMGIFLAATGLALGTTAFRTMRDAQTSPHPQEPVTAIVSTGPFQLSRNPIYLSMTLLYSGIAVLSNALWPLLLLPIVLRLINRGVIDREEAYLERKFGAEYMTYKQRVSRWL